MSKGTTMTIRIEPDLRTSFARAAEAAHRPAAQVLRDLMRGYVEHAQSKAFAIDAQERQRREEAVRFAHASVGLEGYVVSEADKAQAARFINGEIDLAEFVQRRGQ